MTRIRVLIVDDNADVRLTLPPALEAVDDRLEARAVRDYWAALDVLPRWAPDVVLLDLVMPRSDGSGSTGGMQLLLALQRFRPLLAVVVHTGKSDDQTRRMAMLAGARAFVPKPTAPTDLAQIIRRAVPQLS